MGRGGLEGDWEVGRLGGWEVGRFLCEGCPSNITRGYRNIHIQQSQESGIF
jgi:hypothetical protein